jgi:hypothetical protein
MHISMYVHMYIHTITHYAVLVLAHSCEYSLTHISTCICTYISSGKLVLYYLLVIFLICIPKVSMPTYLHAYATQYAQDRKSTPRSQGYMQMIPMFFNCYQFWVKRMAIFLKRNLIGVWYNVIVHLYICRHLG